MSRTTVVFLCSSKGVPVNIIFLSTILFDIVKKNFDNKMYLSGFTENKEPVATNSRSGESFRMTTGTKHHKKFPRIFLHTIWEGNGCINGSNGGSSRVQKFFIFVFITIESVLGKRGNRWEPSKSNVKNELFLESYIPGT